MAWFNYDWQYRRKLTIDNSVVTGVPLTNFPVQVWLTSGNFDYTQAQQFGSDIRFTDSGDALIDYEIEHYNTGNNSILHVRVPDIPISGEPAYFWMYWGWTGLATGHNPTGVWRASDGYLGVFHLNETAGSYIDSGPRQWNSFYANPAKRDNVGLRGTYAPSFSTSANKIIFKTGLTPEGALTTGYQCTGNMTLTVLARLTVGAATKALIQQAGSAEDLAANIHYGLEIDTSTNAWQQWEYGAGTNVTVTSTTAIPVGSWFYLNAVRYATTTPNSGIKWYLNGNPSAGLSSFTVLPNGGNTGLFIIGNRQSSTAAPWSGLIDDICVETNLRSDSWIKLSSRLVSGYGLTYEGPETGVGYTTYETSVTGRAWILGVYVTKEQPVSGKAFILEAFQRERNISGKSNIRNSIEDNIQGRGYITRIVTGWWDNNWLHRQKISLSGNQFEDLVNFPVLIKLDTGNFNYADSTTSGVDLRFVSGDRVFNFEVEKWTHSGESLFWVQVPFLSSGVWNDIYLYYGNTNATRGDNPTGTWDSDYEAVYHFNVVSGGNFLDSTKNVHHSDDVREVRTGDTTSIIGTSLTLTGRGYDANGNITSRVGIPNSAGWDFTDYTVEAMVAISGRGAQGQPGGTTYIYPIITKGAAETDTMGYNVSWFLGPRTDFSRMWGEFEDSNNGANWPVTGTTALSTGDGTVYHVAQAVSGSGIQLLYLNGIEDGRATTNRSPSVNNANKVTIGTSHRVYASPTVAYSGGFYGTIDEVRISKVLRSSGWMSHTNASNRNQIAIFYTGENQGAQTSTLTEHIDGIAFITGGLVTKYRPISGRADIRRTVYRPQQGTSLIYYPPIVEIAWAELEAPFGGTIQIQQGTSCIRKTTNRNQAGISYIYTLAGSKERSQQGRSSIKKTVIRNTSGVSRIKRGVEKNQQGLSRIRRGVYRNQSGIATLRSSTYKTQSGRAFLLSSAGYSSKQRNLQGISTLTAPSQKYRQIYIQVRLRKDVIER